MKYDEEPIPTSLRELRRAYKRQRYEGDLGALVDPARRRSIWPPIAAAALLAVCALVGWQAAIHMRATQPVAQEAESPQVERSPRIHTLEHPEAPGIAAEGTPETGVIDRRNERRPVLPGLMVMSSPRATPPPRPTYAPRPSLALLQSRLPSESIDKGSLP